MTDVEWEERTRLASYGVAASGDAVLLARSSAISDFAGQWSLPGGGVDFGEHPADALVREVAEETGLLATIVGKPLILSDVMEIPARSLRLHHVRLCYPVHVKGELRHEQDGTTDVAAWVPRRELRDMQVLEFTRKALIKFMGPEPA